MSHTMVWRGGLLLRDRRRLELEIHWGPGTPFLWPSIYPVGIKSLVHMYSDGSACLAAPAGPEGGWSGVVDIGVWLDKLEGWLPTIETLGAALPPEVFAFLAPWMPRPRRHRHADASTWLAFPPSWGAGPPAEVGRFRALVPQRETGLGTILSWQVGRRRETWDAARDLVDGDAREVNGLWLRSHDPEGVASAFLGLSNMTQGRADRTTRRELTRIREQLSAALRADDDGFIELIGMRIPRITGDAPEQWLWRWSRGLREITAPLSVLQQPQATIALTAAMLQPEAAQNDEREQLIRSIRRARALSPTCRVDESILGIRRSVPSGGGPGMKLRKRAVAIVGLGALGSEVAYLLAKEGIGSFVLVDPDVLEPGNVTRHRGDLAQVGRAKTEVVRELILRVSPSADIRPVRGWVDELLRTDAGSSLVSADLAIGLTAEEGIEGLLDELCEERRLPALHGWLEMEGQVLRLFRVLPGRDPSLLELMTSPMATIPPLPRAEVPGDAAVCADLVLPGSQLTIHAAANFIAQTALAVLRGDARDENHWLFAPAGVRGADGVDVATAMPALARAYGVWQGRVES